MKVSITGASNFVNRMFEACGAYQWAREFLKNALEAGATRVEFGIEWQAVGQQGVYRRTIADDGCGMSRDELLRFFSTLGEGAKPIGGIHDNFGVGAKVASLPWNPEGVVVMSRKADRAAMIWILLDPDSGDYELAEFDLQGNKSCAIDPSTAGIIDGIDWSRIEPDWIREHGTVVVLLGSEEYPDTVLGNPHAGETSIKGLSVYLNSRFWDLSRVDVRVVELRSERKSQWPQAQDDRDDARRPNNRQICGARYYLTEVAATKGGLRDQGTVLLDTERVMLDWYLWQGERPAVDSYARKTGYIAVRYRDELFQLTIHKAHFRWFGIIEGKVQQNLTLVLEPPLYEASDGRWGIHPDQSRNRLIFTGNGEKGIELPLADWGAEFAQNLPAPILEAIRQARGDLAGSIEDEDYRRRLQDKFGKRWTFKVLVKANVGEPRVQDGTKTDDNVDVYETLERERGEGGVRRRRRKTVKVIRQLVDKGAGESAVERDTPVDVPRFRLEHADSFEKPWHIALWAPNDPVGPTVLINVDSPILQEIVEYHQQQYADVFAEDVARTVRQVFGEIAACKIAHSQKLRKRVAAEELDREYRSEQSLTIALMGLMAEESVIAQRLGRFGRKRPSGV
ncbi:MAG: ATP-binding protein [Planctomycetota bacterium]